jgi:hypothetical protein
MARMHRKRALLVPAAAFLALALAGTAQAYRRATVAERHAITRVVLPGTNSYFRGGKLSWAEVSTAGPYAVVYVAARPHNTGFQNAIELLKRTGHRWIYLAAVLDQDCPGVPRKVLLDFRHFFAKKEPKFLAPGEPGYYGCAARIAYAK